MDGLAEFLFGVAGAVAFIASNFITDGVAGFLLGMFAHGALNSITHALVNGFRHIWEGIFGPLTSADKVLYDMLNLIGDGLSFVVFGLDSIKAYLQIAKEGGNFLVKLKNLFIHGTNQKTLGGFFGDIANMVNLFPNGLEDYENLREDSSAAYGWNLPSVFG